MPYLTHISPVVPEFRLDQKEAADFALRHFAKHQSRVERFREVFLNTGIESRYISRPLEWLAQPRDFAATNEAYIETAVRLSSDAILNILKDSAIEPERIGMIIYVNSTGIATPSIDARIMQRLNLPAHMKRLPIWGLGCAGGVAGIAHAHEYLIGHPKEAVIVVACELCSLTFLPDDFSKSNIVATALFGDGAAAALLVGDECMTASKTIRTLATRSRLFPDSLDVMGWHVKGHGLQVIFAERIPELVLQHAKEDLEEFCQEVSVNREDIRHFALHPGGTKVLAAYEESLGLASHALDHSRNVLRKYGNMSSVTALFVLSKLMKSANQSGLGICAALGPGFSAESVLFESSE